MDDLLLYMSVNRDPRHKGMVRDVNFSGTFKGMQSNSANEGKKEGISAALCSV